VAPLSVLCRFFDGQLVISLLADSLSLKEKAGKLAIQD
jgi:hypothetical protein